MWGFFEDRTEFIPSAKNKLLFHKIYPEWDDKDYFKPGKKEVECVLNFCNEIDFDSYNVDKFKQILDADCSMSRKMDDDIKNEEEFLTTDEKFDILLKKLTNENIKNLCKSTMQNFIKEVFHAEKASLQMFKLYKHALPEQEKFIKKLFMHSYGLGLCMLDDETDPIEKFCTQLVKYDFDIFELQLKICPKLENIINKGILIRYYETSSELGFGWVSTKSKLHIRRVNFDEWRNLSGQIYFDHHIGSIFGTHQLLWIHLIKDKADFNMALDMRLFDKVKYEDFKFFSDYYRAFRYHKVDYRIYDFIKRLNYLYYVTHINSDKYEPEIIIWSHILYNDADLNKINFDNLNNTIPIMKNVIKILIKNNVSEYDIDIEELIATNNSEDMEKIKNMQWIENTDDILQIFQASLIYLDNTPNFINIIHHIENIVRQENKESIYDYIQKCMSDLMGSFIKIYSDQINTEASHKKYEELEIPSLSKLIKSDFIIRAQDKNEFNINDPIKTNSTTMILLPIDFNDLQWVKRYINNKAIKDVIQLYYHIIPDKNSFMVATDNRILTNFTWETWCKELLNKNSENVIPIFLIDDCERLQNNFYNYWKSLYRDIANKRIYDPISLYFGLIGLIFAFTGVVQMILAAISLKLQLATS